MRATVFAAWVVGSAVAALWVGGCESAFTWSNSNPTIEQMLANGKATTAADPLMVMTGTKIAFLCRAYDKDADPLTFTWTTPATSSGVARTATAPGNTTEWTASARGDYTVVCTVTDGRQGGAQGTAYVRVSQAGINTPPTATLSPATLSMTPGATSGTITCTAKDVDGDELTYAWFASAGTIAPQGATAGKQTEAEYTAPATAGPHKVYCIVSDGKGSFVPAVCEVTVSGG